MVGGEIIYRDRNPQVFTEGNPKISIVIPAYNEAGNLPMLYSELIKVLPSLNMTWEIILVDDGSEDGTWMEITSLYKSDKRVRGIRLSRNFGHQYALFAGLSQATGEAVITMDADLQHSPQTIPVLVDEWMKGNKIVHTVRSDPKDLPFLKRITSRFFYRIFSFLSGVKIDPGMADFRLLDRQVVDEIVGLRESRLFLRGLVQWVGYPSSKVEFQSGHRFSGESKYSFHKMLKFAWTGITSFSIVPLRLAIILGLISSIFAFYRLVYALYIKLFTDRAVPGWASLTIVVSLLFGILFILLGILGEYIARILEEVRSRPRFIVSERIGFEDRIREDLTREVIR
jgi:dolichol-phosphate mannosyltransferase